MNPKRQGFRLRKKLLAAFIGLSLSLVVLTAGLSLLVAYVIEDLVFERILLQEVARAKEEKAGSGLSFIKKIPSVEELPIEVQQLLKEEPRAREFATEQGHYHLRISQRNDGTKIYWLAKVDALLSVKPTRWFMLVSFSLILLLVMSLAYFLAKTLSANILQPLESLAASCDSKDMEALIGGAQLDRLENARAGDFDEVQFISQRLQQVLQQLQQSLARERDFSRDIGHELRTPISIYKNILDVHLRTNSHYADLDRVYRQLCLSIDSLMALARHEPPQLQSLNLTEFIEQAVLDSGSHIAIELNAHQQWPVAASPGLLQMLLKNLIANALEHGCYEQENPVIQIRQDDGRLIIENPISKEIMQAINVRDMERRGSRASSSSGIGQGLYLVRRICVALGWTFRIAFVEKHLGKTESKFIQFSVELDR